MPDFSFSGWSAADLGMTSFFDLFGGGPFTVAGDPDTVVINDGAGDTSFDEAPGQPGADPGADQTATGDLILDGAVVVPDGNNVWNIGEFTVTNLTTGEVGTLVVFGDTAANPVGASSTIRLSIGDELTYSNFVISGAEPYENLVCFAAGTQIETDKGLIAVEEIKVGDRVRTQDHGFQVVRWAGCRRLNAAALFQYPKYRPVRITAGALGDGLPKSDLVVSRQHRIVANSKIATRMFGHPEVLVAAIKLTELPGIFVDHTVEQVAYYHLLFDQHEVIFAEGTPSESLYTGTEAIAALEAEARDEVLALFPELADMEDRVPPARLIPENRLQKKLISRHFKNGQPLRMDVLS